MAILNFDRYLGSAFCVAYCVFRGRPAGMAALYNGLLLSDEHYDVFR